MNLGDWLRSQGVGARDLRKAVKEARSVVQTTHVVASVVENVLLRIAAKPNLGKKTKVVAVVGVKVARTVRKGASDMLAERKRK